MRRNKIIPLFFSLLLYAPFLSSLAAQTDEATEQRMIRGAWQEEERNRLRGASGNARVAGDDLMEIDDYYSRKFKMDLSGKVFFRPREGDWRPILPVREDVTKYLAEADALLKEGLSGDALLLWKTISALSVLENQTAAERDAIETAVRKIGELESSTSYFPVLDRQTEPVVLFDRSQGQTHVIGLNTGIRIVLPGAWTYYRTLLSKTPRTDGGRYLLYLRHAEYTLTAAWDLFSSGAISNLNEWISMWDRRRNLTKQIEYASGFVRKKEEQLLICDSVTARNKNSICASYDTTIGAFRFFEHFRLYPGSGIYLDLRFTPEGERNAATVFRYILERTTLRNRYSN